MHSSPVNDPRHRTEIDSDNGSAVDLADPIGAVKGDEPALEVAGITKRFPGVVALDNVSIKLGQGEVLAVIGENGAGKSTLMKILAGVHIPDTGHIFVQGTETELESPRAAMDLGIALIHQELSLLPNLTVGANIFLGREPHMHGWIRRRVIARESEDILLRVGLRIVPDTLVGQLPIGHRQLVEIARALSADARILIMDEPTSSLSDAEADVFFGVVRELRSRGVSIVYVSHRLREIMDLADCVVVLRDGKVAGELTGDRITRNAMVRRMVGRDVTHFYRKTNRVLGETTFEANDLVLSAWPDKSLNISLRAGEIVGLAGLVGSGRTELLRAFFGVDRTLSGHIRCDGCAVDIRSPSDAIEAGIALVPEDRGQQGLILNMAVEHNLNLSVLRRDGQTVGWLDRAWGAEAAARMISKLDIKTPSGMMVARKLSGGNQQKVVLGKWLLLNPRVLLLDEPTRGIDIGAKEEIYRLLEELADEGVAILFASSELDEVLGMSDRVIVMHEGRLAGELERDELSEEAVMHLATGRVYDKAA